MRVEQELDVVPRRPVLWVTAATVVITALGVIAAWGIHECRSAALGPAAPEERTWTPVPERIGQTELWLFGQTSPAEDRRQQQQRSLTETGWVDADAGVARIPIDEAMELYRAREAQRPAP